MNSILQSLKGGIIVSCQAIPEDATFGPDMMLAFALSAKRGGAVGIRANSAVDVKVIKDATGLPLIGIWKRPGLDDHGHIITPTLDDAIQLEAAGADIIALDVTDRPRPGKVTAAALVRSIKDHCRALVMADCVTYEQALRAQDAGADIAATTLAFDDELGLYKPNLAIIEHMARNLHIPVIAEGRFWDPQDVTAGFEHGAHAIVIGSAITRPWMITERYVLASQRGAAGGV